MNKKILVCVVLALVSVCAFSQSVEKLDDKVIQNININYNFIDMADCEKISEYCILEKDNDVVIFDSFEKVIKVYSKNPNCKVAAKDCEVLVNTGVVGLCDTLYKF